MPMHNSVRLQQRKAHSAKGMPRQDRSIAEHARMYDNSSQQKSQSKETVETDSTKISKKETEIGTTSTGKTLYQGPRGGIYHISKSGKKVYHKRK